MPWNTIVMPEFRPGSVEKHVPANLRVGQTKTVTLCVFDQDEMLAWAKKSPYGPSAGWIGWTYAEKSHALPIRSLVEAGVSAVNGIAKTPAAWQKLFEQVDSHRDAWPGAFMNRLEAFFKWAAEALRDLHDEEKKRFYGVRS